MTESGSLEIQGTAHTASTGSDPDNLYNNSLRLHMLWCYLASWISPDGGVNGPVVHRCDLKRILAIHDTPWTQQAVIAGLLQLYRRSGNGYWLSQAIRLADAQCERQDQAGRFRWAGHEDDRFSSLVHNTMADCALLNIADVLKDGDDVKRRNRYLTVARKNLEEYVIGQLYRKELSGFAMNPVDYYSNCDRFVVNMNSVAIEALVKCDLQHDSDQHLGLIKEISEKMLSLQTGEGICAGSLPYSHLDLDTHIPLYSALALRCLPILETYRESSSWKNLATGALSFLDRMTDKDTGLWFHKVQGEQLFRFPIFIAGAGMICNGILDAARLTQSNIDEAILANRLLRHQYPNGAIRNFIGYDHPDNERWHGNGTICWEDMYPTPNWNAQAFHFLSRILPPPEPPVAVNQPLLCKHSRRYIFFESKGISCLAGTWPPYRWTFALYVKRFQYGFYIPSITRILRFARNKIRDNVARILNLNRLSKRIPH